MQASPSSTGRRSRRLAVGKGDVIVWSDTEGLLGDISLSLTDIHYDEEETAAFFGAPVTQREINTVTLKVPHQIAGLDY